MKQRYFQGHKTTIFKYLDAFFSDWQIWKKIWMSKLRQLTKVILIRAENSYSINLWPLWLLYFNLKFNLMLSNRKKSFKKSNTICYKKLFFLNLVKFVHIWFLLVGNFLDNAKSTNYKVSNFKRCWWLFNHNPFLWIHRSLLIIILDFCMSIHDTSVCHHVMSSRCLISTEKQLGQPRKAGSI